MILLLTAVLLSGSLAGTYTRAVNRYTNVIVRILSRNEFFGGAGGDG